MVVTAEQSNPTVEVVMDNPDTTVVIETTEPIKPVMEITFRVTAYCACEHCCGEWANDRPLDETGEPIVYGASGEELVGGVSCASPLPFGTQIALEGYGLVDVQDRTADWVVEEYGENIIDIYFTDHQTASEFECQYLKGVVI